MKADIHPDYVVTTVKCSCGNEFQTRSTVPELHIEICSNCHPFYTGKQKLVDTGGRVERFQKRYEKQKAEIEARTAAAKKRAAATPLPTVAPAPEVADAPMAPPEPADTAAPVVADAEEPTSSKDPAGQAAPATDTAPDAPAEGAPAPADA